MVYIIHGSSRSFYHLVKFNALEGCLSQLHNNTGARQPRSQTMQLFATIITNNNNNFEKMPNKFLIINHKPMNDLKVVPSTINRKQVNYVRIAYPFL